MRFDLATLFSTHTSTIRSSGRPRTRTASPYRKHESVATTPLPGVIGTLFPSLRRHWLRGKPGVDLAHQERHHSS